MRYRLRDISLFLALSIFIFGCAPKEEMPRLIALEDFFKNPEKTAFSLSPDGEHLALMKPWEKRLNVHVQKIGEEKAVRITGATERDIADFFWANNNRIAYVQDTAGDLNFRLYAVNIDGSELKELTPFEKVRVSLIDRLENDDEHMLIQMNKRDARVFDVYRISINTGEMEMIAQNPGNIISWQSDHDGNLRIAGTTDGVNTSVLYRDSEKDDFQILITTNFKETLDPLFFTFDNKNLYVASNIGRDKRAIYEYDIKKKETTRLLFEHPEVDVAGLMKSDKRKKITGVTFIVDKRHHHFFDEEREQLQK
ncbi:MAG: S9 family peptidase, partial [Candidatus Aminicenantes bacterium]